MCRIALYASSENGEKIKQLIECFKLGTLYDFVLDKHRRGRRAHVHGWGYAYVYELSNDMGYSMYKTSLPMTVDGIKISLPRYFDWILMIIHSRLTGGEPIDVVNSHPYYFHIPGGVSLWLVHNGSVDKEKLAKEIRMENLIKVYSDSYMLTQWFGKNIKGTSTKDLVEVVHNIIDLGVVKSALNFAAIIYNEIEKNVVGLAVNYVIKDYMDMYDYYALYNIWIGDKTVVISSSTTALYLSRIYGYKAELMDNGTITIVRPRKDRVETEVVNIER